MLFVILFLLGKDAKSMHVRDLFFECSSHKLVLLEHGQTSKQRRHYQHGVLLSTASYTMWGFAAVELERYFE